MAKNQERVSECAWAPLSYAASSATNNAVLHPNITKCARSVTFWQKPSVADAKAPAPVTLAGDGAAACGCGFGCLSAVQVD